MTGPAGQAEEPILDAEVVPETDAAEAGADQAPADAVVSSEHPQIKELTEALQRERAQFVNFRRRSAEEALQATSRGKQAVVEKLLPLLDDFDRAREHGDLTDGPLKAFADKLDGILAGEKVERFGASGDRFDPERHEAIQNDGSGVDPVIGQVFRSGYRLGDKVIRHAMVTVTDPAPAADEAAGTPGA